MEIAIMLMELFVVCESLLRGKRGGASVLVGWWLFDLFGV